MRNPHFFAKPVCLPHVLVCFTLQWTPSKITHRNMFPLFQFISDIIPLTKITTLYHYCLDINISGVAYSTEVIAEENTTPNNVSKL